MKCEQCKRKLTWLLETIGDTQGEYEIENGHKDDCRYYKVAFGGRDQRDRIANAPMPKIKANWTYADEMERRRINQYEK